MRIFLRSSHNLGYIIVQRFCTVKSLCKIFALIFVGKIGGFMNTIYERIIALCNANGTTITALCEELKGSKGNLSTWRRGNLKADDLLRIADKFCVSVDYLLGRSVQTEIAERPRMEIAEPYKQLFGDADFLKIAQVYASIQDAVMKGALIGAFLAAAKSIGVDTSIVGY